MKDSACQFWQILELYLVMIILERSLKYLVQ